MVVWNAPKNRVSIAHWARRFFVAAAVAIAAIAPSQAAAQFHRCSWEACEPQDYEQAFQGAGTYRFVISARGLSGSATGHLTVIRIYPTLADAWRFDAGGCQTSAHFAASTEEFDGACPTLRAGFPAEGVSFDFDSGTNEARLRLELTGDPVVLNSNSRYLLWRIAFDHSQSVEGPPGSGAECGGADATVQLEVEQCTVSRMGAPSIDLLPSPSDEATCRWVSSSSPVLPRSLAAVKAQYR